MPIMDYKKKAEVSKKAVFEKKSVTDINKKYLSDFLLGYEKNVSPARVQIFCSHIWRFLERTNDIKKDMTDRAIINKIFSDIKEDQSLPNYATIISVSSVLVRWLNDGETPQGFRDIKMPKKSALKRNLSKDDLLTWEEGLKIISLPKVTNQFKAIFMTQLDGGFRPSELVDLNYGDCEVLGDVILVHVRAGKTGKRDVPLYKSVPFLLNWLNNHPTKNDKDPLWIMEHQKNSRAYVKDDVMRYEYPAIRKRFFQMGSDLNIKKPLDLYSLRHSACRLAKLDNIPLDVASEKFGHSPEFFLNTYGRLDAEDKIKKFKQHLGFEDESTKKANKNIVCELCNYVNPPRSELCQKCGRPTTITKALERTKELETLKSQMGELLKRLELIEQYKKLKHS